MPYILHTGLVGDANEIIVQNGIKAPNLDMLVRIIFKKF